MKHTLVRSLTSSALVAALLASAPLIALAHHASSTEDSDTSKTCYDVTLKSGTDTKTAGYTQTAQTEGASVLLPASYSGAAFTGATATEVDPSWVNPATSPHFLNSGALWVSTHTSWPGGTGNTEGSTTANQFRLFEDSFSIPAGATYRSAKIYYTADNATSIYLNGNTTALTSTSDVYGDPSSTTTQNYANVFSKTFTPDVGTSTLDFVVRNWAGENEGTANPTGLLYKATVHYCIPNVAPPNMVTVTIDKFIDGVKATAGNADSASFPMHASWNDPGGIGAGSGNFALGTSSAYSAVTASMKVGADYATNEDLTGTVVGASCGNSQPFSFVAYTTGDTYAAAVAGTPTTTAPSFTNLQTNKYVIIWNHDCSSGEGTIGGNVSGGSTGVGSLQVTSVTPVHTDATADNTYAHGFNYVFHITVPTSEPNLAMKFADWFNSSASSTIAAGGNMRISSAQADNGGATVPIVAANTYSIPDLHMITDLDAGTPGIQVDVTVELKVPVGTVNGAYTTSYGVRTLP